MSDIIARRIFLKGLGRRSWRLAVSRVSTGRQSSRALVIWHRTAKAQGAAERLRLSHAHLRQPFSRRSKREAAAGGCDNRRLSAVSETDRHNAQRRGHALDLRHGQFLHARCNGQARRERSGRRGGRHKRQRRRTQATQPIWEFAGSASISFSMPAPPRIDMLEPLVEPRPRSRLACANPHARRPDRPSRRTSCDDCPRQSCSTIWRAFPQPAGVDHPAFAFVRKLLDGRPDLGQAFRRLPGHERRAHPTIADVSKVARAYVNAAPERLIWGSDWPHPTERADAKPNDAVLFDLLTTWAPEQGENRNRILVDNPAELYQFGKAA